MSCLIPENKRPAVEQALRAAFGASAPDGPPVALSGGLSGARLMRIRVGGIPYVLRLETEVSAFGDPARARTYDCMRAAADALLSPRVWHADPEAGVTIIDHVPQVPLSEYPGDGDGLLVELAQALRVLHRTPPFPPAEDFLEAVGGLIRRHHASGLLAPAVTAEVFARFDALRGAYRPREEDLVSSHNDLNPANILYDGRRLWLIDWEVAFRADRFLDLAAVANWFGRDAAGEELLLRAYLGSEPDPVQRARLRLMRQANHVFYGAVFLVGAAAERPGVRLEAQSLDAPPLADLRRGLGDGAFSLQPWENRVTYGKARLAEALSQMRGPAFAEALDAL